jgi:hypothetical protein
MAEGAPADIAMSRFGYLGTALPSDASRQAQADVHAGLLHALGIHWAVAAGFRTTMWASHAFAFDLQLDPLE